MEITTHSPPWGDKSSFQMIDVGAKTATHRRALAEGSIELAPDAFIALRDKKNPKGDVLSLAEVAGIMAAKRTADTIPLCHPLPLDYARVSFSLSAEKNSVTVFCEVGTTAKTGVEMEALAGVNGALLTIYDLSKAVNPVITISGIYLKVKEGGKSGIWRHPQDEGKTALAPERSTAPVMASTPAIAGAPALSRLRAGVLTISDRVSAGKSPDGSGPHLAELLVAQGAEVTSRQVISDDKDRIQKIVLELIRRDKIDLLITTGGTGLGPRDVTPEALMEIATRKIDGFGELLRQNGAKHTPMAYLSRSLACIIDGAIVIALPGSRKAVGEGFEALLPLLPHALHTLRGGDHG